MLYQCYPKNEHESMLFPQEPYTGFGLEPEVNQDLFLNCPELEDAEVRMQLTEYACFLWHWRNPESNPDWWFGTTSYRQLDKNPFRFIHKKEIEEGLSKNDILAWGKYTLLDKQSQPQPLSGQAESCHPGINKYITDVLDKFNVTVPDGWGTCTEGYFANYWVMSNELLRDYMEFSWPMVKWSLENVKDSDYYKMDTTYGTVSNSKATGYFMERLFILWYLLRDLNPYNLGPVTVLMSM
ncbi:MAG: hypothetical protein ACTSQA_01585 [Candidatus Heimdallarchaeaceae archaeon]